MKKRYIKLYNGTYLECPENITQFRSLHSNNLRYLTNKEYKKIINTQYKRKKIFFTHHCDGSYYTSILGEGIKIDNMTRKDLFRLWWSVFKEWITGDR